MLLQGARIEISALVQRRMVIGHLSEKGEIVAGEPRLQERRQIGVVGQDLVDLGVKRTGRQMRHRPRVEIDQRGIAGAGLEQKTAALTAPRLQIDHHPDPGAPSGIGQKRVRPQHGIFFAIGEKRQNRMPRSETAGLPGPNGFQDGGDTGTVIAGARPRRHRVHMRHQDDGGALARRHFADQIGDGGAGDRVGAGFGITAHGAQPVGLHLEPAKLGHEPVVNGRILGRAGRMRALGPQQTRQNLIGAGG